VTTRPTIVDLPFSGAGTFVFSPLFEMDSLVDALGVLFPPLITPVLQEVSKDMDTTRHKNNRGILVFRMTLYRNNQRNE
jgi:hypothetical protein